MKTTLAVSMTFAAGLCVASATAQAESKPMGGAMIADFGPVNDRLSDAAHSNKLPLVFPMMGGQGFGLLSHFVVGGSGAGLFSQSEQRAAGRGSSADGGWGTFDFGYQLLRVNGFLLAPLASLGGYAMGVTLHSTAEPSFDEALASPARGSSLSNTGALAGVSVLANLIILGSPSSVHDARTRLCLGLRIGGQYGMPFREWQTEGVEASDGPSFGLRGGYAALSLGPGSF